MSEKVVCTDRDPKLISEMTEHVAAGVSHAIEILRILIVFYMCRKSQQQNVQHQVRCQVRSCMFHFISYRVSQRRHWSLIPLWEEKGTQNLPCHCYRE